MSEAPLPDINVEVEPPLPDLVVAMDPPLPDISVSVHDAPPINVIVEAPLPEYFVTVSEGGGGGLDPAALQAHISSPNPHPIYDDGPSLALLYQNAKV